MSISVNSIGPSRRSWSALAQLQNRNGATTRKQIGVDALPLPQSPAHKSKPRSSSRKFNQRHLPLFIFSFAIFVYVYIIQVHIDTNTTSNQATPAKINIATPKAPNNSDKPELIHIIQTRFMQHQPNLLSLGQARLELFTTFCLPSLEAQLNKNFIWIIRTDPQLHPTLRDKLIKSLHGKPNYILLGSNYNPEGFGRQNSDSYDEFLREDSHKDASGTAQILSGNITLIEQAFMKSNNGGILLETRLDADDGLHRDFVKTVHSEARHLAESGEELWRIWCINYNVEWHPLDPFPMDAGVKNRKGDEGYLVMYSDPNICTNSLNAIGFPNLHVFSSVTPGLTFGYGRGASRSNIGARLRHDEITRKITPCTPDDKVDSNKNKSINTKCFSRLSKLSPGAIRSRTATSAGMDNVVIGDESHDKNNKLSLIRKNKSLLERFNKQYYAQEKLWNGINILFKVTSLEAKHARKFMVENIASIADDNLKGQCTPGHSCKNGTQSILKSVASTS